MFAYQFGEFGLEHLRRVELPEPTCGPGQVLLDVRAISLNYRDLLVIKGLYNPKLRLPAAPVSDGAGVVAAVGAGVSGVRVGDRVMTCVVVAWKSGAYRFEYLRSALGTPGPGLAAERVVLPADALLPLPAGYDFAEAATLPIAGLTAWDALTTVGRAAPGQTVLTLGTGGVAIFTLQLAKALGARVIITSSSDEKLARARTLGADVTINYRTQPDWELGVLSATDGLGVDLTVETAGAQTLAPVLTATRAGGRVAVLGALTGLSAPLNLGAVMMKRLTLGGVMLGPRDEFEALAAFLPQHGIRPVIGERFAFDELPAALAAMASGRHFGKIVLTREGGG
jgi:NADPH:quinone reductase-like Zn-dependent oxidoreductase